jgi:hypothetical protein
VTRPKVNFQIFYSADKHRGVKVSRKQVRIKRERRSEKGSEGTQDPVKMNRLPLSSTRGLATDIKGNSIQK